MSSKRCFRNRKTRRSKQKTTSRKKQCKANMAATRFEDAIGDKEIVELVQKYGVHILIKEEVKHLILTKRKSQQKGDVVIDLEPKPREEPSEDDLAMQADRRNRNNAAARKYRSKLRSRQTEIEKEEEKLLKKQKELEEKVAKLRQEQQALLNILNSLPQNCCEAGKRSQRRTGTSHWPAMQPEQHLPTGFGGCQEHSHYIDTGDTNEFGFGSPTTPTPQQPFQRYISVSSTGFESPDEQSPDCWANPYVPRWTLL